MMTAMYVSILSFLLFNTLSFYLLDWATDRMKVENSNDLTPRELTLYTLFRIIVYISLIGMVMMIVTNLVLSILKVSGV